MATYNTAFGALPSTKTLTGRTNTTGRAPAEERQPRNFMQQYAAQRQGGQQPQPQDQTFADLQRQGRARPAPMMTPSMAPGAQPSPFLSQVQGVVTAPPITPNRTRPAQPAAPQTQPQTPQAPQVPQTPQAPQVPQAPQTAMPGPGPITSTAPTAGVPPFGTAPPPATPMAPPAGATPFEAMPPSGLAAQVAGVIGAQQASASQASTSQAPATWTDNNGTVWERTGDRWNPKQTVDNKGFGTRIRTVDGGVETDPVTGLPRVNRIGEVIGAFQPERIYVDPRTGITWLSTTTSGGRESWGASSTFDPKNPFSALRPLALGPGSGNIASAMAFMEMYGKPETADEMALLANSNSVSVQDLQREIERYERTMPKLTTLSDRAVAEEEKAFQKQAGLVDEKTGYLTTGRVPDYLIYVPRSEGGPGYRAMTFDERRAYIARTNPNALAYVQRPEQYQQFLQQQPEFGGWKTSALTGGRLNIPAGAGPETPGIRRPYTPPASGRGTGSGASNAMLDRLNALFDRLEAGATDEERRALEAERAARTADLTAKFGGEKTALEEELARRGLYASSIGGGRLGDLGGQQARALAGMEAEILNKQAELAADRQRQLMTGLTSVFGTQAEVEYRAQQLQQEERLRGREMDINEARDRVRAEIDREELKLRRDLGNQTFGLGRDQFIVDLIKAVGSGNVDPETLKKMLEKFGLKYTPGAGDGVKPPPGSDDDPMRGGGDPNNPETWPAGSSDGVERVRPVDGAVYVWRASLRRWVPKPPPGGNGTTGTQV